MPGGARGHGGAGKCQRRRCAEDLPGGRGGRGEGGRGGPAPLAAQAVDQVEEDLGHIDVLVSNAGVVNPPRLIKEGNLEASVVVWLGSSVEDKSQKEETFFRNNAKAEDR